MLRKHKSTKKYGHIYKKYISLHPKKIYNDDLQRTKGAS